MREVIGILTMSVTAKNPFAKVRFDVTETVPWCPIIPTPIMVIMMAPRIEMNEATLKFAMPFSVRGSVMTKQITTETTAQTTEQEAPSVTGISFSILRSFGYTNGNVLVSNAIVPVRT